MDRAIPGDFFFRNYFKERIELENRKKEKWHVEFGNRFKEHYQHKMAEDSASYIDDRFIATSRREFVHPEVTRAIKWMQNFPHPPKSLVPVGGSMSPDGTLTFNDPVNDAHYGHDLKLQMSVRDRIRGQSHCYKYPLG